MLQPLREDPRTQRSGGILSVELDPATEAATVGSMVFVACPASAWSWRCVGAALDAGAIPFLEGALVDGVRAHLGDDAALVTSGDGTWAGVTEIVATTPLDAIQGLQEGNARLWAGYRERLAAEVASLLASGEGA